MTSLSLAEERPRTKIMAHVSTSACFNQCPGTLLQNPNFSGVKFKTLFIITLQHNSTFSLMKKKKERKKERSAV
jgi:hypothetical protein